MNKLFTKIAGVALGLTLAIGVGVAVGASANKEVAPAHAANPGSSIYTSGQPSWGTTYSHGEKTLNSVSWYITTYGNNNSIGWNKTSQDNSADADFGPLTQSDSSYGMYQTSGDFTNAQKITVSVTNTDAQKGSYAVFYSTNSGSTWTSATTGSVTTTKGSSWTISYDHGSKIGNSVRFAFGIYGNTNTTATRLSITQIEVWEAASASYTVSFNANGGTGSMANVPDQSGNYTLPANGFTAPNNKAFAGWKANNAGNIIAVGGTYALSANVEFYAQWVDAYTVTYNAGSNGSGSYAHSLQPSGTYTLLPFASLTGVSASSGYKFKNYTVGDVAKNPGDTITLNTATTVTVNFEVKPMETTYDFTANFSTYASAWTNSYGDHTGLNGKTDIGGDYAATIDLHKASKQTATITTMPVFATKTDSGNWYQVVHFTLTESGYKIKEVQVTFAQWLSKTPDIALFKGNTVSGTPLDSGTIGTKNTISTSNLNGTDFSIGYCDKSTSNVQAGISSIYITLEALASFGTLDHITITGMPNNVYHIGETYDATGFAVTAYDGVDESTANFKDVTASVETDLDDPTPFVEGDVPGFDCEVSYTGDGGSDTTSFHVYVYALAEYELITEEQTDWSGTYLIVSTNHDSDLVAMNGGLVDPDVENGYKIVTDTSGTIEAGQELEWTIAKVTGGYSIQGKSGKYIGSLTSASNGMLVSDSAFVNTIEYSDEDGATIIKGTNNYHLKLFVGTGTSRFRYYNSGNVQLYKLKESDNADAYAQLFLGAIACDDSGENEPTFNWKEEGVTRWSWSLLSEEYNTLTAAEKEQFRLGVASETGTNIEKALARYNYIVAKYGTAKYSNFMARTITPLSNYRTPVTSDNGATVIVTVVSILSLTSLGAFFFMKKRKEQ